MQCQGDADIDADSLPVDPADGFGPASETFARSLYQRQNSLPWTAELPQDKFLVGTVRTRSTDSLVTDSAASATAYSCGLKSNNAYIGVTNDQKPCGTVLEGAKHKGYNTALVTTSRVTHATPASYSAHVPDRDNEAEIASQQLGNYAFGRQVDILWGGGRGFFLPNSSSSSSRKDSRDLISEAKKANWSYISNRDEFLQAKNGSNVTFPSLGLFSRSHMAYEVDRNKTAEPSLTEMAIAALNALKKAGKPFFIMIEGARIDHAAHNNDPIGHYHDIIAYQEMVDAVSHWVEANDQGKGQEPEIVMIGTSDHECGGLSLAWQRPEDKEAYYGWYPDVVLNGTHSTEYLAADFLASTVNQTDAQKRDYMVNTIIKKGLGVQDANDGEVQRALDLAKVSDKGLSMNIWLAGMVNWRSSLAFATTGHSGTDVNLYYYESSKYSKTRSQRLEQFRGNHENTWVGTWTVKYLGLDLQPLTNKLNNGTWVWADHNDIKNYTTGLPTYHGGVQRVVPSLNQPKQRGIGYSYTDNLPLLQEYADAAHRSAKRSHAEL